MAFEFINAEFLNCCLNNVLKTNWKVCKFLQFLKVHKLHIQLQFWVCFSTKIQQLTSLYASFFTDSFFHIGVQ